MKPLTALFSFLLGTIHQTWENEALLPRRDDLMLTDTNPGKKHPWWNRNSKSDLVLEDVQAGENHPVRQLTLDNMTNKFLNLEEQKWEGSTKSAGGHPRGSQFVITISREGRRDTWHLAEKNSLSRYLLYLDTKHLDGATKQLSEAVCCGWHVCMRVAVCVRERDRQREREWNGINQTNICRRDGMAKAGQLS